MPRVGEHIEQLVPYAPGKPIGEVQRELGVDDCIKLASNENPLGPSPRAMEAMKAVLTDSSLYPDGGGFYLKGALSERLGVSRDRLVLGNGSNEIIELLIRTFMAPGDNAVTSAGAFIIYKLVCQACDREIRESPLTLGLAYDLEAMARLVDARTRLIFLANPNNPTGTCFGQAEFDRFLAAVDARAGVEKPIVVLDEAYREYVDQPDYPDSMTLAAHRPHTVVMRTFSKAYGLAGIRCGYGISTPEIVNYLNRIRAPFNVNSLALVGAQAALEDDGFIARSVAMNRSEKARLEEAFTARALGVTPSQTNFLLVNMHRDARAVYGELMSRGVIVRPMTGYGLASSLRITVGTPPQNTRLLEALDQIGEAGRG